MTRLAWLIPLCVVALVAGLLRVSLDADVFNLLPRDSRMVQSLQLYQQDFGSSNELILLLRTSAAESSTAAAERLAADVREAGLAGRVVWRNPFVGNPAELGELLAYLWFNRPHDEFAQLARRFDDESLAATLDSTLERMAVSFQPLEVAQLAADPFRLGEISQHVDLPVPDNGGDPFASADGTARIVVVAAPFDSGGFFRLSSWVDDVEDWLDAWRSDQAGYPNLAIGVTGNPAFVTQSGSTLLRDVLAAATGTMILVALLFWLVHRRWRPLLWLVTLLTGILAGTALIGATIFGTLHAVSLGFAAILLGLAADYGLILYQETVAHPGRPARDYRRAVAPAILWSAVTTAGAFFMIGRSSLPGLTQLGVLVGVGILIAAVVMLAAYVPLVLAGRRTGADAGPDAPRSFRVAGRPMLIATAVALLAALLILVQRQPTVDSDARSLDSNPGTARAVLDDIHSEIGGFRDDLWLVATGETETDVGEQLAAATPRLDAAVTAGTLASYQLPAELWPRPDTQQPNRALLNRLVERWPAAETAALAAGFAESSLQVTRAVFATWARFGGDAAVAWPEQPGARWIMSQFASRHEGRMAALGRLQAPAEPNNDALRTLSDELYEAGAGQLVSWTLLADSLLEVMNRDVDRVLIPMVIALLVLLVIAFRSVAEVALSMACLALSLAILLAVMALLGWSWNLMNVMALPMLFGAGVDYSLHVQFALRRYAGDPVRTRNTVGRAILLCAGSTAAGFATLGFASNAGIASLGRVCATGIVITSIVAVFLLPAWWRIMPRSASAIRETA